MELIMTLPILFALEYSIVIILNWGILFGNQVGGK